VAHRRRVAADHAELSRMAAAELARRLRDGGSVSLAGGSTPRPAYELLAAEPGVRWERVTVYFGDERAVAPDDARSNYRMAREALLDRLATAPRVYRMEGETADLEAAARRYEQDLPDRLDVLVLGMGADGHTASLFPGSPALRERRRRVVPVEAPADPPRRLTITPPVIAAARQVIVIVSGGDKADAVARALEGDLNEDAVPAALAREGLWLLDRAAAGRFQTCSSE
jgi:6-phosphogluconolactonase